MGDPKKPRKKYSTPRHPWMKGRIEEEKELKREYGFKNKKELWKVSSKLKKIFDRAKKYSRSLTEQSQREQKQLLQKLQSYGLLQSGATLDQILGIQVKDLMERRLQTVVFKKGLSNTMNQARQFIVHGHVNVGSKKITSPSYLVTLKEESEITFNANSALNDEGHPERMVTKGVKQEPVVKKPSKKETKKVEAKNGKN